MAIYRVAVRTAVGAEDYINVFHLQATGSSPAAVAQAWVTACGAAYLACLPQSATLEDVTVTDLSSLQQAIETIHTTGGIFGGVCPPQAAGLISWRTAQVGRAYRGRSYIPCVPEGHQELGTLDSTITSLYATLAASLSATWPNALGGDLVVFHKATGTGTAILSYIVRDIVYTQRRRTLGQGT